MEDYDIFDEMKDIKNTIIVIKYVHHILGAKLIDDYTLENGEILVFNTSSRYYFKDTKLNH